MRRFLYKYSALFIVGLSFFPVIAGFSTLWLRDILRTHFAFKVSQVYCVENQSFPFLDPLKNYEPLAANPNSFFFYPTTILFFLLDPLHALNLHIVLHLSLAYLAFFYLSKQVGLCLVNSILAATFYTFSGFSFSLLSYPNLIPALALIPYFIFFLLRKQEIYAAVSLALIFLAGDPTMVITALIIALFMHVDTKTFALSSILALLLSLPQLVLFLEILDGSGRTTFSYISASPATSFTLSSIIDLFIPLFFGSPTNKPIPMWGVDILRNQPFMFSLFSGFVPFLLMRVNKKNLILGALVGIILSSSAVSSLYPSFFRFPVKFWLIFLFFFSLLGALGDQILRKNVIAVYTTFAFIGILLIFYSSIIEIDTEIINYFLFVYMIQFVVVTIIVFFNLSPFVLSLIHSVSILLFLKPLFTPVYIDKLISKPAIKDPVIHLEAQKFSEYNLNVDPYTLAKKSHLLLYPFHLIKEGLTINLFPSPEGLSFKRTYLAINLARSAPLDAKIKLFKIWGTNSLITLNSSACTDSLSYGQVYLCELNGNGLLYVPKKVVKVNSLSESIKAFSSLLDVDTAVVEEDETHLLAQNREDVATTNLRLSCEKVTFNVYAKERTLLVVNVPAHNFFDLYINGKKSDFSIANLYRVAFWVPEGYSTVELTFSKKTFFASFIGPVFFLFYCLRRRLWDEKN